MAVYTKVTKDDVDTLFTQYTLGDYRALTPIQDGVSNTNYFLDTTSGEYILTILEEIQPSQVDFFIEVTDHLSRYGIPCPQTLKNKNQTALITLQNKPAILANRLPGKAKETISTQHLKQLGTLVATLHTSSQNFHVHGENHRGLPWRVAMVDKLLPVITPENANILQEEMAFQALFPWPELPSGIVHADLFRDNVLFDGEQITGIIDFYFACTERLLLDVAIIVNDWCTTASGELEADKARVFLQAYAGTRAFTMTEQEAWPAICRLAALRFWLSRLHDDVFTPAGALVGKKDPNVYKTLLLHHRKYEGILME